MQHVFEFRVTVIEMMLQFTRRIFTSVQPTNQSFHMIFFTIFMITKKYSSIKTDKAHKVVIKSVLHMKKNCQQLKVFVCCLSL